MVGWVACPCDLRMLDSKRKTRRHMESVGLSYLWSKTQCSRIIGDTVGGRLGLCEGRLLGWLGCLTFLI